MTLVEQMNSWLVDRYARVKPAAGQLGLDFEQQHPRESQAHDGKRPGEFAPKDEDIGEGRVRMVQAPAGGKVSDVDGKFYKGGQWMPVHGLSAGREKTVPRKKDGNGSAPVAGHGRKPVARRLSKQQQAEEQERMERQRQWGEIRSGVVGELFWTGEQPGKFGRSVKKQMVPALKEHFGSSERMRELAEFVKAENKAIVVDGKWREHFGDASDAEFEADWEYYRDVDADMLLTKKDRSQYPHLSDAVYGLKALSEQSDAFEALRRLHKRFDADDSEEPFQLSREPSAWEVPDSQKPDLPKPIEPAAGAQQGALFDPGRKSDLPGQNLMFEQYSLTSRMDEWFRDRYAKRVGPAPGQGDLFGGPVISGNQQKQWREEQHPREATNAPGRHRGQFAPKHGGGQPVKVVDHGHKHVAHVQHPRTGQVHQFEGQDFRSAVNAAASGAQKLGFVIEHPKQQPELGGLFGGQQAQPVEQKKATTPTAGEIVAAARKAGANVGVTAKRMLGVDAITSIPAELRKQIFEAANASPPTEPERSEPSAARKRAMDRQAEKQRDEQQNSSQTGDRNAFEGAHRPDIKEGDTKTENGHEYVLRGGRWHRVDDNSSAGVHGGSGKQQRSFEDLQAEVDALHETHGRRTAEGIKAYGEWLRGLPSQEAELYIEESRRRAAKSRRSKAGKKAAATRARKAEAQAKQAEHPAGRRAQELAAKQKHLLELWQVADDPSQVDQHLDELQPALDRAQKDWRLVQNHQAKAGQPHVIDRNRELPKLGSIDNGQEMKGERDDTLIPWTVRMPESADPSPRVITGAHIYQASWEKHRARVVLTGADGESSDTFYVHFDRGDQEKNKRARQLVWAINKGQAEDVDLNDLYEFLHGDSLDHSHRDYWKTPTGAGKIAYAKEFKAAADQAGRTIEEHAKAEGMHWHNQVQSIKSALEHLNEMEGPQEGDTKTEDGHQYVLKNGRWHRVDDEERQPQQKASEAVESDQAQRPFDPDTEGGYKPMLQLASRINAGELSLEEFRQAHARMVAHEQEFKADLQKRFNATQMKNIGRNFGDWHSTTKPQFADSIYERLMENAFDIGDGMSTQWTMQELGRKGSKLERLARHVESQTEESLQQHVDASRQRREERKAAEQEAAEALENPQSLADFEALSRHSGYESMTAEQQATFDDLKANQTRSSRQEEKQSSTVEAFEAGEDDHFGETDIIEGYHQKKGVPTFTVTVSQRVSNERYQTLKPKLRQLGGNFVNGRVAKRFNATEGFQFFERSDAEAFQKLLSGEDIDRSGRLERRQRQKEMTVSERLLEHAERLESRAAESHGAERRENTHRQQAMADSARARAAHELNQAKRLRSVAESLAQGESQHLRGMKALTHMEALQDVWNDAGRQLQEQKLAEKYGDNWRSVASYDEREAVWKGTHRTEDAISLAKMPRQTIYGDSVRAFLDQAAKTPGLKMDARRWLKALEKKTVENRGESPSITLSKSATKDWFDFANKAKRKGVKHDWGGFGEKDNFQRLYAMGIQEDHELRAALREFAPHQAQKDGRSKVDPVEALETKIHREHQEKGFYPTPPRVIDRLLEHADIQEGHAVLEPSAGSGRIMDAIKQNHEGATLSGVEQHGALMELLNMKGHAVEQGDFLKHSGRYDRIVMNPPFENNQAIDHVRHAFSLLKPGGRLVAVVPGGDGLYRNAHANQRRSFSEFVDEHGTFEELDAGSFAGSDAPRKTGVNSSIVILDKPSSDKYFELAGRMGYFADRERYGLKDAVAVTETNPSEAQKEAGNYRKGKFRWNGLTISIENPRGSVRRGHGWETVMQNHYGYVNSTNGADGDQVDVFLGPHMHSEVVFVVNQVDQQSGRFDEHKCMLGFTNERKAREAYLSNYSRGWKCGDITPLTLSEFKQWLQSTIRGPVRSRYGNSDTYPILRDRYALPGGMMRMVLGLVLAAAIQSYMSGNRVQAQQPADSGPATPAASQGTPLSDWGKAYAEATGQNPARQLPSKASQQMAEQMPDPKRDFVNWINGPDVGAADTVPSPDTQSVAAPPVPSEMSAGASDNCGAGREGSPGFQPGNDCAAEEHQEGGGQNEQQMHQHLQDSLRSGSVNISADVSSLSNDQQRQLDAFREFAASNNVDVGEFQHNPETGMSTASVSQRQQQPWEKSGNISLGGTNVVNVDESQPDYSPPERGGDPFANPAFESRKQQQAAEKDRRGGYDDLHHGVRKAIEERAMEYELDPVDLFRAAEQEHQLRQMDWNTRQRVKDWGRKGLGINAATTSAMENSRSQRSGDDFSDFPGLDEFVTEGPQMFPEFDWGDNPAQSLMDAIHEGAVPAPKLHDPEILNSAADYIASVGGSFGHFDPNSSAEDDEPVYDEWGERLPFSWPRHQRLRGPIDRFCTLTAGS